MCSGAGLPIVGGFIKGLGAVQQGRQQRDYDWERAAQDENDALYERQLGIVRASKVRKAGVIVKGQARAAYAASGVEVGRGTPVTVAGSIGRNVEEDAITQILTGERRATMLEKDAAGYRTAGANATKTALISGISSLLGGAGDAYTASRAGDDWIRMANMEDRARLRAGGMGTGMGGYSGYGNNGLGAYDPW